MYSMVLMAAMLPSGDAAGFGKKNNGCNGGCHGTVVAAGCTGSAPAGCTGTVAASCNGSCHGSCHGRERGGFLGLRDRNSCNGGGFLGHKHKSHGCSGGGGCTGVVESAGCTGGGIVVTPAAAPAAMPPKQ